MSRRPETVSNHRNLEKGAPKIWRWCQMSFRLSPLHHDRQFGHSTVHDPPLGLSFTNAGRPSLSCYDNFLPYAFQNIDDYNER
jgi:hypothetical protein